MLRYFWLVCGFLSLSAGIIGIVVPLLPTTPLILLAAAAFAKSSTRFHHYLVTHRHFGPMIQNWQENRTIPPRAKIIMAVMITISVVTTIVSFLN